MRTALLTGGGDRPYALGLATALLTQGLNIDFIGSDELRCSNLEKHRNLTFLNLRGDQTSDVAAWRKLLRVVLYYFRLINYAAHSRAHVFHILWNNRFEIFDRTLLILYYKLLGKRVVLTAHNINTQARDDRDSALNRLTLKIQYQLSDCIFVHSERIKRDLLQAFPIHETKIQVIPFGINNTIIDPGLTSEQARAALNLSKQHKVLLFFGNIAPYKGLEFLVEALEQLLERDQSYRLIIAGRPKHKDSYWPSIHQRIQSTRLANFVLIAAEFIPDSQIHLYFTAADVLILPYVDVYQSGVLFLGYNFGVPAIATNVGSLADEIVEGETGFVCAGPTPPALVEGIECFFKSALFNNRTATRSSIKAYANEAYSWTEVGARTAARYHEVTGLPVKPS